MHSRQRWEGTLAALTIENGIPGAELGNTKNQDEPHHAVQERVFIPCDQIASWAPRQPQPLNSGHEHPDDDIMKSLGMLPEHINTYAPSNSGRPTHTHTRTAPPIQREYINPLGDSHGQQTFLHSPEIRRHIEHFHREQEVHTVAEGRHAHDFAPPSDDESDTILFSVSNLEAKEHKSLPVEGAKAAANNNPDLTGASNTIRGGGVNKADKYSSVIHGQYVSYRTNQVLSQDAMQEFLDARDPNKLLALAFSGGGDQLVRVVQPESAQVILSVNGSQKTILTLTNQLSLKYGVQTLPPPCYSPIAPSAQYVAPVLAALSRWYHYLHYLPYSRPFQETIELEFYKLRTGRYDHAGHQGRTTDGPNLNDNGVVDFVGSTEDHYGLKITNRSTQDLYVYLFDFSATSLAITPLINSSTGPILRRNGSLALGYGSGGMDPLVFGLHDRMDCDVSVFKLFVSTRPANFQSLQQNGPFEEPGMLSDSPIEEIFGETSQWDTCTMTLVHRRYPIVEEPTTQLSVDITTREEEITEEELASSPLDMPDGSGGSGGYARTGEAGAGHSHPTAPSNRSQKLSRTMSVDEITALLCQHGCRDITTELNHKECSSHPYAHGGSADIYRGQLRDGMTVAIKRSRTRITDDEAGRTCLKAMAREGYTWSKYRHPNVLESYGIAHFQGGIALVAPWMDNGTVMDYIKNQEDANRPKLCVDIACGLAYLHQVETTHGDLKGANVLVSHDGVAKLNDFGSTSMKHHTLQFTGGTHSRSYTLRWAAPELLDDDGKMTASADVYALGMTVLEVITGKQPFEHIRAEHSVVGALSRGGIPKRPESCIPHTSKQGDMLWNYLQRCWKTDPKERPSAKDVLDVLSLLTPEGLHTDYAYHPH